MKNSIVLYLSVLLFGCSSGVQKERTDNTTGSFFMAVDTATKIKVELDKNDFFDHLGEHLNMVSYVKLAAEPLLAPLRSVQMKDDRIYVQDRSHRLVCYNMDGRVEYQIYAVGNGPGEYAEITSFALDTLRGELVLYDNARTSLIYYSLVDGRYLRTVPFLKPAPSEMVFHDCVFFYNHRNHRSYPNDSLLHYSLLSSRDGLVVDKTCFPHDDSEEDYIFSTSLQTFNVNDRKVYYCKNFDNHVYELQRDSIRLRYVIDFPNPLPASAIKEKMDEWEVLKSNYSFGVTHIYETGGLLYFRFYNGRFLWNVFYDLQKGKQVCCVKALQNGYTSNIPLIDVVNGVYEGMFYSVLTPEFIDYYVSGNPLEYPAYFQDYDAETDNPIIMFYRVNK